ncbi:hypothetical protein GCM10027517_21520 [Phycicoccus ginsengisoli]
MRMTEPEPRTGGPGPDTGTGPGTPGSSAGSGSGSVSVSAQEQSRLTGSVIRAVRRTSRRFGDRRTRWADLRAGTVLGVESVPDGLAAGVLAGVNPVHGLFGYLVGTATGALATSSVFMSVQVTGAMAVIIADIPVVSDPQRGAAALSTLSLVTGLVMLGLGLARLGSLVRFVPNAVLVGFVNGVAVNIVLGQLGNLTGYASPASGRLARAVDTVLHPGSLSWSSVAVGCLTIVGIVLLDRTRLGALGLVVAVAVSSAAVKVLGLADIRVVGDLAAVPDHLPTLALPSLSLVPGLLLPGAALALVGLVQGAAISNSLVNPDGRYADASRDFSGQGVANLATSVLQGMPVGGSMSATSLLTGAGARSAGANLVAAVVMAVVILTMSGPVSAIAMPALAALLVVVGVRTLRLSDLVTVWRTGPVQAALTAVTLALTLTIPLQYAVLAGVGLAIVLHSARQANRVVVRRWVFDEGSSLPREVDPPATVGDGEVVVLVHYGSLFFAASPVLEAQLPEPAGSCRGASVILRLRGTDELGSTFVRAVTGYAERLAAAGGTLVLVGVGPRVADQLRDTGALATVGKDNVHPATDRVGESLEAALREARARAAERE